MKVKSLEDTKNLANNISDVINAGDIIFIYGEIGVGKTTLTRFIINYLESKNGIKKSDVLSPTFNIVYDYDVKSHHIMHYDLYRLKSGDEIKELGIFENSENSVKIIEWPELIKNKIENKIELHFSYSNGLDYRNIDILRFGKWKKFNSDEI